MEQTRGHQGGADEGRVPLVRLAAGGVRAGETLRRVVTPPADGEVPKVAVAAFQSSV